MGVSSGLGASGLKAGVCTSTTRPASPYEGQMIYETDTDLVLVYDGTAFVQINSALTKAPRGIMGLQTLTTAFATSATHTTLQDTGMTLTFTEVVGRRYKITAIVFPYPNGGLQAITFAIVRAASTLRLATFSSALLDTGIAFPADIPHVYISVASGSATYKVQVAAQTNNTAVTDYGDASFRRQFVIEDIGAA